MVNSHLYTDCNNSDGQFFVHPLDYRYNRYPRKFIDNRNHLYALSFHPIEMENLSYCYVLLRRLELLVYVVFPFMELKNSNYSCILCDYFHSKDSRTSPSRPSSFLLRLNIFCKISYLIEVFSSGYVVRLDLIHK